MQKDNLLLCAASFTDLEIKHPPEKSYWIRIVVDGKKVFESQKRVPGSSASWKEKKESFPFLPTSTFEVSVVQEDWLHSKSGGIVAQFIGQPGDIIDFLDQAKIIQLEDLQGGRLSTTIAINFALETNTAQTIMDEIEKDLSLISQRTMADLGQTDQDYSVVDSLSACTEPLGNALHAMAKIMDGISDTPPILKVAWTVLSSVYKAVKTQGVLDGKITDLSNTLKELLFVAKTVLNLSVVGETENIGKAALEVATLISKYMELSSLAKRTVKYQISDSMKGRIGDCQDRCKLLQEKFNRLGRMHPGLGYVVEHHIEGVVERTDGIVDRIDLRNDLDDLAYIKDASWMLELCCLAGTREEPINRIMAWIDQADPSKGAEVFLITEVAGAGKSALAHSIARLCQEKGVLKTSCFFQRDSAELNTPAKFISTLARDLSDSHGPFARSVCHIIDRERGLASNFSYRQFEELILKPSSLLPSDNPIVVIIDALDGCAERSDTLLKILRVGVPQLPGMFRFFVTSRPTPELDKHLSGQPHVLRQSLGLNELSNLTDIQTYISHHLGFAGGKQPDAALVKSFSVASEGLFIWASTIVVDLQEAFDPEAALRRILDENRSRQLPIDIKMNQLYTSIMERHNWNDPDFTQAYRAVMGMVLTAREPLPISVLASLSPAISSETFANVMGMLRPVLHCLPTGPTPFVHKSFHDFMVTCPPDRPYHLNMVDHEHQMTTFCLDFLNRKLREPIPGTGYLVDNILLPPGIPHIPDDSVSEELWYSCRFWIDHCICLSAPGPAVSAALRELIGVHFVRWIEICVSKGSFTGIDPSFVTWLKSALPDIEEMVYSIPHLVALARLSERLRYDNRCNEALLVMEPVTERQSAEWINNFLHRSWSIYEPVLSASIFASLDPILSDDILSLTGFTLGSKAPRIEKVHTFPITENDVVLMDCALSFTPGDTSDMTEKEKVQMTNPKITLAARVGKGSATTTLPILVDDISFNGLLRIRMKFMTNFPYIQIMGVSFLEKPVINYVLKPIGDIVGFNIANILRLSSLFHDMMYTTLESMMYDPNIFTLDLEQMLSGKPLDAGNEAAERERNDMVAKWKGDVKEGDVKAFLHKTLNGPHIYALRSDGGEGNSTVVIVARYIPVPVVLEPKETVNNQGILRVELLDGCGLPGFDMRGKPDVFATFELNGEDFEFQTWKKPTPDWNEYFEVAVPSRFAAEFVVEVFDWNHIEAAKSLGIGKINLSTIEPFEPVVRVVNLVWVTGKQGQKGEVRLRLVFEPMIFAKSRKRTSSYSSASRAMTNIGALSFNAGLGVFDGGFKHKESTPVSSSDQTPQAGGSLHSPLGFDAGSRAFNSSLFIRSGG